MAGGGYQGPRDEHLTEQEIEAVLPHYEGLIHSTTRLIEGLVEEDPEDIRQIFRVKLFTALRRWDPKRSTTRPVDAKTVARLRDAFIFGCIANQKKDLLKRPLRHEGSVERVASRFASQDSFDSHFGLTSEHEEIYGAIEDDDLLLPSTLTVIERGIIALLYVGRMQIEAAAELSLTKGEMERAIRSIRVKLADWRPSPQPGSGPTPPLPGARVSARRPAPARRR